jgi:hypothetical protein
VIECGVLSRGAGGFKVLRLCIQSSAMNERPHEIRVQVEGPDRKISAICSCKGGSGNVSTCSCVVVSKQVGT